MLNYNNMFYGLFNEQSIFYMNKFDLIRVIAWSALTIYCITNTGLHFYNNYILEYDDVCEEEEIVKEELYKNKYKKELYEFVLLNNENKKSKEDKIEENKKLKFKAIEDELPTGLVKIFYNYDTESFNYYSNDKNVKYEDLEALCRLYVIKNDCVDLYINREEEYEKSKLKIEKKIELKKENEKTTKESNKEKKSVFAKFKEYNVRPGGAINMEENIIVCENALRFSYKGNLKEFELYHNEINNKKFYKIVNSQNENDNGNGDGNGNGNKEFSFKDFKRMIESTKTQNKIGLHHSLSNSVIDEFKNNEKIVKSWIDINKPENDTNINEERNSI